jgi:tetratricopeptide (TPR) repeat protein
MRFRKTLSFLISAMGLVFALPAWTQQKPLTQDQVQSLVRSGLGDETGAKAIEQRGIDFSPPELREAVRLDDNLAEAHYDIARMGTTLVDQQTEMAHVRKALSLRPDFAEAHELMAAFLGGLGPEELQSAIAEYREAIRLRPDYADAYQGLSYALHRAHDDQGSQPAVSFHCACGFRFPACLTTPGRGVKSGGGGTAPGFGLSK